MRRLSLCVALAVAVLVTAPTVFADGGPISAYQGGPGVVASHLGGAGVANHGTTRFRYVALSDEHGGTLLLTVVRGAVSQGPRFAGSWGIPAVGNSGTGLSRDDRTLILASTTAPYGKWSKFLVVDLRNFRRTHKVVLRGSFSFDALSPDASRVYLIQYASRRELNHYIVRAYDLRTNRLLPGRIADRSEHEKSMAGYPVTRTVSANGRWDYTLYAKPSGGAFVHALDTVRGVAHCIDLPANRRIYSIVLSLRDGGRTLSAHTARGRPWVNIAVGSWRVSAPAPVPASAPASARAGSGSPWVWIGPAIGGVLLALTFGALLIRRRRREEREQRAGQELGLA